ncbi:dihydroxyacetone kinase-like protein [Clostridium tetanomorphum]|uniref:dihydroxyacetone kinase subunit DhaL n=1 Tax=Clostridium tetanomorphum TaxID=1553 RepID=UPI00044F87FD|nr:dihydroxyacetone kinase subunit DhaL [Clostridium tetanomorphum]KAJ53453.1 dihydroxyacetone kinase [Clostridium tetanomorphum DSM 665]MBP1865318.1 dihydroxyacetone kinase-like protein [Clostridium tetanomorphum]NRS85241.1 dihydroxyacetone kinase-like protein [Clostridium tetanomorphum]SQC03050.1 dihydroxyacetone kinase [Clostridium tetanomorphum]
MALNVSQVVELINNIANVVEGNKVFLTELDSAIGDGDHGINMNKGFKAVKEKLITAKLNTVSDVLKNTGMILVSNVGGASGPLYGTAFMKAAIAGNKQEVNLNDFINMLQDAVEGIKMRGKAQRGDKTMLDALEPALDALKQGKSKGLNKKIILENMRNEAFKGVEYTKEIIAKKGRASYLGERSIGHQDPGATSSYLILNEVYNYVCNNKNN